MPTIDIDPITYQLLARRAAGRQTSVEVLVATELDRVAREESQPASPKKLSAAEFARLLDAMAVDVANPPPSDITYSREDIYFDHD